MIVEKVPPYHSGLVRALCTKLDESNSWSLPSSHAPWHPGDCAHERSIDQSREPANRCRHFSCNAAVDRACRRFLRSGDEPGVVTQVPAAHVRWAGLLRTLGVVDAPTPHHLLQLLAGVAAATRGASLNANERRAALRLLATLCDGDGNAAQVCVISFSGAQTTRPTPSVRALATVVQLEAWLCSRQSACRAAQPKCTAESVPCIVLRRCIS